MEIKIYYLTKSVRRQENVLAAPLQGDEAPRELVSARN